MNAETPESVLVAFGLRLVGEPVADGRIHRVAHSCRSGRDDAGWYLLYADPVPHLIFGCFRCSPETHHWGGSTHALSSAQRTQLRLNAELNRQAIEADHARVTDRVRKNLADSRPADPNHPYLLRKRIGPHQARQVGDCLFLPLQDAQGQVWSAQTISPSPRADWGHREKSFERGGRVAGCFHLIGSLQNATTVVVCEGFATGATIAEVTDLPVACAMHCGNLEPVVASLTEALRGAVIVIAADQDRHTPGNPGLTKARSAARKFNALLALPDFGGLPPSADTTDFNDLRRTQGDRAVREAIQNAITPDAAPCDRSARLLVALPDCISTEMPAFLDRLAGALVDANERRGSPRYFSRGDAVALLIGQGRASRLLVANEHLIRAELQRDVHFVRRVRDGGGEVRDVLTGVLPQPLARDIAKTPVVANRLPPVDGIAGCPILDRSGNVTASGYVPDLNLVCSCDPWDLDQPSLEEARNRLLKLLADYRFVSRTDQQRALAALLQPALVMGGHVERGPALLVVADQPSTGKGTLVAQRCAIYGATAAAVTMRERGGVGSLDEDLSAQMISGSLFLNIDNARGAIRSQVFEAALTEPCVALRVPFRPSVSIDPSKLSVSVTSNGVSLTPDLALRCNIVRLRKQPANYRFQTPRPVASATAQRGRILSAVFAIIRDWIQRGSPRVDTDYDGHARDFWGAIDEMIPRNFGGPRPTDGLKAAALAGADPLMEFLRAVGLALATQGALPSPNLSAVQLLRIAGDAGIPYDGRIIPTENENRLLAMAASFGRRASNRFDAGPLLVEEFSITLVKDFLRRDPNNPAAGTYLSKLYCFATVPARSSPSDKSPPVQQPQQETGIISESPPSTWEFLTTPAVTAGTLPDPSPSESLALPSHPRLHLGPGPQEDPDEREPNGLPSWWQDFRRQWAAAGLDRSPKTVASLLGRFGCSLNQALAHGWLELTAQRIALGPALNGACRPSPGNPAEQ